MTAPASVVRSPRGRLYLALGLAGLIVLLVAYSIGNREQAAKQANIIPGVGVIDSSGNVVRGQYGRAAVGMAGGGKGMRGGGGARAGGGGGLAGGGYAPQPSQEAGFEPPASSPPPQPAAWPTGPMLIRTASLQVRVEDVAKAHAEVVRIAREAHGYVADTTLSAESGPAYATITIRVPSEGLESVMDRIAALGKLLQKQISAQEVTEEYVDLTSRRRNLEREEQRLLDLLQRAGKIRELLDVESTLARVRGEIEHIAGRMRYLENRVSLSTIRVQLEGPQPKVTAGGPVWTASDVTREALRSLLNTGRGLATMAIWLGIYAVIWLPILLVLVWLARKVAAPRRTKEPAAGS